MTDDELEAKRAERKKPGLKKGRRVGTRPGPVTGQTAIDLARKDEKILQLRMAGATLQQIANEVGYADPASVHKRLMLILREILPDQTRDEHRRIELARLDRIEVAHWPAALQVTNEDSDKHARIVLQCINMRVKLLGLEAPQQLDVQVRQGEMVRVEMLDLLDKDVLKALEPLQENMVRLSELRAGAIDVEASDA